LRPSRVVYGSSTNQSVMPRVMELTSVSTINPAGFFFATQTDNQNVLIMGMAKLKIKKLLKTSEIVVRTEKINI